MNGFDIQIQYSDKAKGTSLEVWPGDVIKVMAPVGTSDIEVQKIISKKARWIIEKSRLVKDATVWRPRELVSGEAFPYLGREYRLKVFEGFADTVLKDNQLIVPVAPDSDEREELIKLSLMKWYKVEAASKISDRVEFYSQKLLVAPTSVKIKDLNSQWGTCTPNGELTFNWQIITLSRNLFDYIVAHEVCHLRELNHGKEFKKLIEALIPEYEQYGQQLKYQKNLF